MSLAADVAKKRQEVKQPKHCKFATVLASLDTEDSEAMAYVMQNLGDFPNGWITDALRRNGYSIGKTVISDHLAGRCACDTSQ